MCLLTVLPMPDLLDEKMQERLLNGAGINGDGSGWAVVAGRRILSGRDLRGEVALEAFTEAYSRATGPAIFHSRWATHGGKTMANVHPFKVPGISDTYVAHNGILSASAHPLPGDPRSDTRLFVEDIFPSQYARLDAHKVRDRLSGWLGGNKIAVLTTNPRYQRNLYLFGMELGEWVDGVWFSNSDYEGFGRYSRYSWKYENEPCHYCNERAINSWEICTSCGTCQDCLEHADECQCFVGMTPSSNPDEPAKDTAPAVLGPTNLIRDRAPSWSAAGGWDYS